MSTGAGPGVSAAVTPELASILRPARSMPATEQALVYAPTVCVAGGRGVHTGLVYSTYFSAEHRGYTAPKPRDHSIVAHSWLWFGLRGTCLSEQSLLRT